MKPEAFSLKRKIVLFFCLVITVLFCFLFSGCSSIEPVVFNSVMNVETDESGTRTITASFSRSTIEEIFGSKKVSFQSFLDAQVPSEMTWDYIETSSRYDITFTITFSSLEEYQTMADSLRGTSGSVTLTRPQVGVSTGFTLTEQSDTASLFTWLAEAMAGRSQMSESAIFSCFEDGTNEFYYAGRSMEQTGTGLYVYVENLLDAEEIDIYTDYSVDGNCGRTVRIHFPAELEDNAPNVRNYLTSLLPEEVTESWESDTEWVLTFPTGTPEEIGLLTDQIFQSQNAGSFAETVSSADLLLIRHDFSETINISFFAPEAGETLVQYFVSGLPGTVTEADADGNYESPQAVSSDTSAEEDGYTCLLAETVSEQTITYRAEVQYQPPEILSEISVRGPQDFRRVIAIRLGADIPEVHQKLIFDALSERVSGWGSLTQEVTENGFFILRFTQNGSADELAQSFESVFSGSCSISYARGTGKAFDRKLPVSLEVTEDYSSFLAVPENTILTVSVSLPAHETFDDGSNSLVQIFTGGSGSISSDGTRPNLLRPWLIALLILLGLICAYLILMGPVRAALVSRRKKNRAAAKSSRRSSGASVRSSSGPSARSSAGSSAGTSSRSSVGSPGRKSSGSSAGTSSRPSGGSSSRRGQRRTGSGRSGKQK
ncbi:MAG: hypothetical protein ACOX8B_09405 [Lachnospiraceae bacterium]|jgi:hypothetical protein